MTKLKASERLDRTAMQLVRDQHICIRREVVKATDKATLARLVKRGYVVRDANSEYSDALQLTWDGIDYLGVLEESWHD